MGKKSSDVEAVDPLEVASTDAAFNRIDQITPTGNLRDSTAVRIADRL
jgi:hypothetical protein